MCTYNGKIKIFYSVLHDLSMMMVVNSFTHPPGSATDGGVHSFNHPSGSATDGGGPAPSITGKSGTHPCSAV